MWRCGTELAPNERGACLFPTLSYSIVFMFQLKGRLEKLLWMKQVADPNTQIDYCRFNTVCSILVLHHVHWQYILPRIDWKLWSVDLHLQFGHHAFMCQLLNFACDSNSEVWRKERLWSQCIKRVKSGGSRDLRSKHLCYLWGILLAWWYFEDQLLIVNAHQIHKYGT